MNKKLENLKKLYESKVVAIIRADEPDKLLKAVEALEKGGIPVIEISMTTPGALEAIRRVAESFGGGVFVGAGTVLDPETARHAILAGAEFVFAPTSNRETIALCKRYSKIVIPGAFSPTEILTAWEWGADLVKVFPAHEVGASFFKAVKAPLPQVDLIAVGGVNLENAADFIAAGASAVGIGSSLVKKEILKENRFGELTELAKKLVGKLGEAGK